MRNSFTCLMPLIEHDHHIYFAFNIKSRRFEYLNPAFYSFFQAAYSEVTLEALMTMIHSDDREYLVNSGKSLRSGELKTDIEVRVSLPDKEEKTVKLTLYTNKTDDKNIITGYLEDITASKAYNDKLKEFSNKKNSILNILSHDLSGPLGSIKNISEILGSKTHGYNNQEVNKLIAAIEKISKKSIAMIQEFIKHEFIESLGVDMLKNRVNLVAKMEDLIEEYNQSENEINKLFQLQSTAAQMYADIDENKFFQAINNLISNALKFTPDGGAITIGLEEKERSIVITISDTGIGIPQKFHHNLFDKFNSARRPGLKGEPSIGLGMSIIKTIIDWHNGKIWFDSKERQGTNFYIEIAKSQ